MLNNAPKQRITVYLEKDLIKDMDKAAKSLHMSRSGFLTWVLIEGIPRAKPVAELMKTTFTK